MLLSLEYISTKLNELIKVFPEIRARYDYIDYNNSHIIQITPNKTYHNNESFRECEKEIILDFIKIYPFENIVFLAEDDVDYKLTDNYIEFKGTDFQESDVTIYLDELFNTKINYSGSLVFPSLKSTLFTDYLPLVKSPNVETAIYEAKPSLTSINFRFEVAGLFDNQQLLELDASINKINPANIQNAGENNYALAA